ncbi:MurR/RpiR family transcriptional regulator [Alisedimentitalea sp. MJ-SS2]|uniref:MurR/RpiR family transcriptional regulator n=1 Tax=Aliisedimentitalea sp. MJ-SS2 TaxID=3049795 RepID=UPI0029134851|nr:MurR/RpiR family transcriptional regulator [Alisedimentitalea sp. MJ-SS2]MDU8929944.1 MurR/RpiR family transcriptional regulator [Alisedimentitalea sp. MJ-SS2]
MTVSARLIEHRDAMTPSERQLLNTLLDDYPIVGLGSITELASAAAVSTTTVARMLQKTGFDGFPQFQSALRAELKEMISDPIAKRNVWKTDLPEEHILNRYSRQGIENQQRSLDEVDPGDFDSLCSLLSDPDRTIFITGGRITGTVAQYLYLHLQMIRPQVRLVASGGSWPHDLLDIRPGDVVVAYDVRRYENTTLQMAQMCHDKRAEIVLFTDQWRSPIHRLAKHTFASRIVVPSAWDTCLPLLMLTECTIAAVQEILWETVKTRTDALETAFDQTKLFRKFT